eukprot:TRINITY_DN39839_c0_g1_i1.p1 TRINITY_DN39839_c0_g1~~TRINITY_DN39839_c0_g1_i1.p1  ORF type:complete len:957 (+),score=106.02 TRINITY_DN39839_c0_g1_i1:46-2916(+)
MDSSETLGAAEVAPAESEKQRRKARTDSLESALRFSYTASLSAPQSFEALSTKVATSASLGGFLAGFAYYEFSRLSEENARRVPSYPILLIGSFTLSVISNAISSVIEMRAVKRDTHELEKMAEAMRGVGNFAYLSFRVALCLYAGALSKMVEVFNPVAVTTSHKWGWFWYALFMFEQYYLPVLVGVMVLLELYFRCVKNSVTEDNSQHPLVAPAPTSLKQNALVEEISKMSGLLGSRALFMLGFVHHSLARYQYHRGGIFHERMNAGTDRDLTIWLNAFFWHFIILSTGCLLVANFKATLFKVRLHQIPSNPPELRVRFVARLHWVWVACKWTLNCGMFFVLSGAMLMGWGCSSQCNEPSVPGGVCYASVAYVPAVTCGFAFATVAVVMVLARIAIVAARRDDERRGPRVFQRTSASIELLGYIGNSATIASGFVMYNIATFDTDVLQGPITSSSNNFGLTPWGYAFLWANWIAFSFGMAAALVVLTLESAYHSIESDADKDRFVDIIYRKASYLSGGLFTCAMCGFVTAFGLFGLAKMTPIRVESAVAAILGTGFILGELYTLHCHYQEASTSVESAARLVEIHRLSGGSMKESLHELRLKQLRTSASRSLLFGGFAYNAVSFLFRPQAAFAPTYTLGMGMCFATGVYVTLCDSTINMLVVLLDTDEKKSLFVYEIDRTVQRLRRAGLLYVFFFLCSFLVMGYIKLWSYEEVDDVTEFRYSVRFGWLQLTGGLISLGVLIPWLRHVKNLAEGLRARQFLEPQAKPTLLSQTSFLRAWGMYQKSLNGVADAAVFQTGNVFYEILFSALGMKNVADYAYFAFSVLTLTLGAITIAVASTLLVWGNELQIQSLGLAEVFVSDTWQTQRILNWLYMGSLYSWLFAMLFSSAVKYPSLWFVSAAWSSLGIVVVTIAFSVVWRRSSRRYTLAPTKLGSKSSNESCSEGSECSSDSEEQDS